MRCPSSLLVDDYNLLLLFSLSSSLSLIFLVNSFENFFLFSSFFLEIFFHLKYLSFLNSSFSVMNPKESTLILHYKLISTNSIMPVELIYKNHHCIKPWHSCHCIYKQVFIRNMIFNRIQQVYRPARALS